MHSSHRGTRFHLILLLTMALAGVSALCGQTEYWERDTGFAPALEGNPGTGGVVIPTAYPEARLLVNTSYGIIDGRANLPWLVRLNTDGSVDSTFTPTLPPLASGWLMLVYPDGRVLYGERDYTGYVRMTVKRLLADGSPDPDYHSVVLNYDFVSAALLENGKLLLWGGFSKVDDSETRSLVRLNADGTRDDGFQSPFNSTTFPDVTVIPDSDQVYVHGYTGLGPGRNDIARLNGDGSVDENFSTGELSFSGSVARVYPQANGTVVFADSGGTLRRLTATGALDDLFAEPALVGDPAQFGPRMANGKVYYLTRYFSDNVFVDELRRMNADFTDDETFPAITTPYSSNYGVGLPVVLDDGTLVFGPLTSERKGARIELSRVLTDGSIDPAFNPRFSRQQNLLAHVGLADGGQVVAGSFDYVDNEEAPDAVDLVRLAADGSRDPDFSAELPEGSLVSRLFLQPDGGLLALGSFPVDGGATETVWRFNTDGSRDETYASIGENLSVPTVDGLGRLYGVVSGENGGLRRYLANGQQDSGFSPSAEWISAYFIQPVPGGGALVARSTGYSILTVERITDDGAVDTAFPAMDLYSVAAMAGLPDGSILTCARVSASGGSARLLKHLLPDGSFDFEYTTRTSPNNPLDWEIQFAMAGVAVHLVKQAAPATTKAARVDFSATGGPIVEAWSDGRWMLFANSSLGAQYELYRHKDGATRDFDPGPSDVTVSGYSNLIPVGYSFSARASAAGLGPFGYQWFREGEPIADATLASIRLSAVSADDAGDYRVVVSNSEGETVSDVITLSVDTEHEAAGIDTPLMDQAVALGDSVTFTVEARGNPAPTYRWYLGNALLTGVDGPSLTIDEVEMDDLGEYHVDVRNTVLNGGGSWSNGTGSRAYLRLAQTLDFGGPGGWLLGASPVSLAASASSGLPVDYEVVSGPATVDGDQLTFTGLGTVLVRASQAGDATYAAVEVERSFVVSGGYAQWVADRFSEEEQANPEVSGPDAVLSDDGMRNLLKYALGLEPRENAAGVPQEEIGFTADTVTYTYARPVDRVDVDYTVEVSTDLQAWTTEGVESERVTSDGATETWRATCPLAGRARVFFRLRVSLN